jgi:hypothetical protein
MVFAPTIGWQIERDAMFRWLRYFVTALAAVTIVFLVSMWNRSHTIADELHGRFWTRGSFRTSPNAPKYSFIIASKEGCATLLPYRWLGQDGWFGWEAKCRPVESDLSFPEGRMQYYNRFLGFGILHNPEYHLFPGHVPEHLMSVLTHRYTIYNPPKLFGTGVIIPYWFLVLLSGIIAALPRLRWPPRISLRGVFIVMTFASLLLGLVGWLDLRSDLSQITQPIDVWK